MFEDLTFFDVVRNIAIGLILLTAFLGVCSKGRKGFIIAGMASSAMSCSLFIWTLLMDGLGMAQSLPPVASAIVLADIFTVIFAAYLLVFKRIIKE